MLRGESRIVRRHLLVYLMSHIRTVFVRILNKLLCNIRFMISSIKKNDFLADCGGGVTDLAYFLDVLVGMRR